MQSTDVVSPLAIGSPIALNGDKNIPPQNASGTDTSSINLGFLPITSEPLDDGGVAPERIDFNGMFYLSTDQRVFLQNGGVITYDATVASAIGGYPAGAILSYIDGSGNYGLVESLIDNNQYNFVSTPSYINGTYWKWAYFNNFNLLEDKISPIGAPKLTLSSTLPANTIWLEGATVSRSTYSNLFKVYGTTYGAGDGSTTFQLPDFRNRAIWGANSFGYLAAGLPNITGTANFTDMRTNRNYTGAFYDTGFGGSQEGGGKSSNLPNLGFDASRSSSIYGKSSTVQPPAIKVRVYTRYQ